MLDIKEPVGYKFTDNLKVKKAILNRLEITEGYCPCVSDSIGNDIHKCPCLTVRGGGECHCKLFTKK